MATEGRHVKWRPPLGTISILQERDPGDYEGRHRRGNSIGQVIWHRSLEVFTERTDGVGPYRRVG